MLRAVTAPNASALTLDGTRTHLLGARRLVVIDPGSADPGHLDAIAARVGDGVVTAVMVTHGHPDHVAGADELAARFDATVRMAARGTLSEGDRLDSDAGELIALATPGHTPDHMAIHWLDESAVFCGDLMMGDHDTALIAPPEGRLDAYLASLARIRALEPRVIYPAHGPPFDEPVEALDRYVRHRMRRLEQVRAGMAAGFEDPGHLLDRVYGPALDPDLKNAAMAAIEAYMEYLRGGSP